MNNDKAAALRALAEAATPGPWCGDRIDGTAKYDLIGANNKPVISGDNGNSDHGPYGIHEEADERYLMAANPAAIIALLDERAALISKESELRSACLAYASEFTLTPDGEPDTGSIHAYIRALKSERAELQAALAESDASYRAAVDSVAQLQGEVTAMGERVERLDRGNVELANRLHAMKPQRATTAVQTSQDEPSAAIDQQLARFAIDGAISKGRMGTDKPPSDDHWLMEYWQIGRQLTKLGETCAWDNMTPATAPASPAIPAQGQSVPENVRAALDRMCTPLHSSRLGGVTAECDARDMAIIKAHIDRAAQEQAVGVLEGFGRESLQDVLEGLETDDQTVDVGEAHIESTAGYVCRLIRALLAIPQAATPVRELTDSQPAYEVTKYSICIPLTYDEFTALEALDSLDVVMPALNNLDAEEVEYNWHFGANVFLSVESMDKVPALVKEVKRLASMSTDASGAAKGGE